MAKKQVLQIKDFSGGVNSYSDPRDLRENEFQALDNAAVDEQGIIRVSGGLEVKYNINLPNSDSLLPSPGTGLFSFMSDYYQSSSVVNTYLEEEGGDSSNAWAIYNDDGQGTWAFSQASTNTSSNSSSYFSFDNANFAINYLTYLAKTSYSHGYLRKSNLILESGKSYSISVSCINENPWYYLGSNIPPRIRLYNSTLGKYLYPSGWSSISDATHNALISTNQGNLVDDISFWNSPGGETISREQITASVPVASSGGHNEYASFFGSTETTGNVTNGYCLKVIASADGGPFTSGNFALSDAITVEENTIYLLDCVAASNSASNPPQYVGIVVNAENGDSTGHIPGSERNALVPDMPVGTPWRHIGTEGTVASNGAYYGDIDLQSGPSPIEFMTPNNCTSIKIKVGVDNSGGGTDTAFFSGFNLRKKMYELPYLESNFIWNGESLPSSNFPFIAYPNLWSNEGAGTILGNPYLQMTNVSSISAEKKREYTLNVSIPSTFDDSGDWVFEFHTGKWGGLNQTGVNNFCVGKIDIVEQNTQQQFSNTGTGNNILIQGKNDNNTTSISAYNYNQDYDEYNGIDWINFPSGNNSVFNFFKGSKDVYFCDKNFSDKNLYSLSYNKDTKLLQINNIDFSGPSLSLASDDANLVGINYDNEFDVVDYYLGSAHAGLSGEQENNNLHINMTSNIALNQLVPIWEAANIDFPFPDEDNYGDKFNQSTSNQTAIEQDVSSGEFVDSAIAAKAFKYDLTDSDWKHDTNPYTKYIVIRNDDIVQSSTDDTTKLTDSSRLAEVNISLSHWFAGPCEAAENLSQSYAPSMTIYLDVIHADAAEGGVGFAVPTNSSHFIANIGSVKVNPDKISAGNEVSLNYSTSQEYDPVNDLGSTTDTFVGWSAADWSSSHLGKAHSLRYKRPGGPHSPDQAPNYLENIKLTLPYTLTYDGTNAIEIDNDSSGVNLQLRFVPDIEVGNSMWYKGIELIHQGDGLYGDLYASKGIIAEGWIIEKISLFGYESGQSANTEDSFSNTTLNSIQANISFETPNTGEADGWDDEWKLYFTSVNNDGIESALGTTESSWLNTDVTKSPRLDIIINSLNPIFLKNKFIKGYMTSNRNSTYNLQFVIDCNKKTIKSSSSGKEVSCGDFGGIRIYSLTASDLLIPNEIDSYESETGVLIENAEVPAKMKAVFKTAVVANNSLYAGNVYQDGEYYPDRMIKSPIGKIPLLPSTNFIDVAINDGDEIVSLQFYKDRILQFKNNKLFIISTSEDYEYLQDTIENVGISQESQVTRTPYGIAWINERGCYLYDGSRVNNLTDNRLAYKKWKDSESSWEIDEKYGPVIHYLKKEDKLIVYGATDSMDNIYNNEGYSGGIGIGTEDNNLGTNNYVSKQYLRQIGYQYDFQSKSWILLTNFNEQGTFAYDTSDMLDASLNGRLRVPAHREMVTNFAYDENGDSIFIMKPQGNVVKWDDYPKQTMGYVDKDTEIYTAGQLSSSDSDIDDHNLHRDFRVITRDYDFGAPSVRKKIYKVYVTFKSTNLESNKDRKLVQSQDLYHPSNVGVYYAINGTNTWKEFSPTKSTNYGTKGLINDDCETTTTLSADVSTFDRTISVASASNIKVGYVLKIFETGYTGDGVDFESREQMLVTSVSGTTIGVRRHYNSTVPTYIGTFAHINNMVVHISTGDWIVAELKPDSPINNIDSFKLRFSTKIVSSATNDENGVPPGFMINDISVIYRTKNVR